MTLPSIGKTLALTILLFNSYSLEAQETQVEAVSREEAVAGLKAMLASRERLVSGEIEIAIFPKIFKNPMRELEGSTRSLSILFDGSRYRCFVSDVRPNDPESSMRTGIARTEGAARFWIDRPKTFSHEFLLGTGQKELPDRSPHVLTDTQERLRVSPKLIGIYPTFFEALSRYTKADQISWMQSKLDQADLQFAMKDVHVTGRTLKEIQATFSENSTFTFLCDPSRDWVPVKAENRLTLPNGTQVNALIESEWTEVDANQSKIWMPSFVRASGGKNGEIQYLEEWSLSSRKINQPVPNDQYEWSAFPLAKDAPLERFQGDWNSREMLAWDGKEFQPYSGTPLPPIVEKPLVLPKAQVGNRQGIVHWLVIANVIGLCLAVFFLVARNKRRA